MGFDNKELTVKLDVFICLIAAVSIFPCDSKLGVNVPKGKKVHVCRRIKTWGEKEKVILKMSGNRERIYLNITDWRDQSTALYNLWSFCLTSCSETQVGMFCLDICQT